MEKLEQKKEKVITTDDFVKKLNTILDNAENDFYKKYHKYPDFTNEDDYVKMADFLDMENQSKVFGKNAMVETFEGHFEKINEGGRVLSHDLGLLLIKRYIKRKNFFSGNKQDEILEAVIGSRYYHIAKKEAVGRIIIIDNLIKNHIPFPEDWDKFIAEIKKISKTCYLNDFYQKNGMDKYRKGFDNIGTYLVNPTLIATLLENKKSWENLKEYLRNYRTD